MSTKLISDSASELIPENKLRKSLLIQNEDAAINVFIKFEKPGFTSVSITNHDHRIGPGAVIAINSLLDGKEQIQGRYTIIAASGTPRIAIFESEEERR